MATVDSTGKPCTATVYYTVDDNFCLTFATKPKHKNIKMWKKINTLLLSATSPYRKLFAGDYITLKIIPEFIKMGIFIRPDAQSNEELYETITFTPHNKEG